MLLSACVPAAEKNGSQNDEDYILYLQKQANKGNLWFYDFITDQKISILPDWDINYSISVNINNELAFSSSHEGNNEVYIQNYPFAENDPINITRDPLSEDSLESWSPDGQYLLFRSKDINGEYLKVWDGTTFTTIGQFQEHISEIAWGSDGKLTFTLSNSSSASSADPSEIYLWNGENLSNVSQNPHATDRNSVWSADGRLAFLSQRNGKYGVYIWDGVSIVDGKPDVSSFISIAPELTTYMSYPAWTNSGQLAFGGDDDASQAFQIYAWDGETVTNISQNPIAVNHSPTWREDGYWAFSTSFFMESGDLFIRNSQNETVMTTTGLYGPAWSHSGKLMFCNYIDRGFVLSVWDGTKIREIVRGGYIYATSKNGDYVFCSAG